MIQIVIRAPAAALVLRGAGRSELRAAGSRARVVVIQNAEPPNAVDGALDFSIPGNPLSQAD